jgi:uncharacterized repeat protein (TIGR01451 family)
MGRNEPGAPDDRRCIGRIRLTHLSSLLRRVVSVSSPPFVQKISLNGKQAFMLKRLVSLLFLSVLLGGAAQATNLTIGAAGRVTFELVGSDAAFRNTLSIASPLVSIASSGCKLEPAVGLGGTQILSEKTSQHGCRVELDSDPATPGIQGFPAGTTFELRMCAQLNPDPPCEFVWSSNQSSNPDNFDHLRITPVNPVEFPGQIYRLNWEDQSGGGDQDFNDLIAIVRVNMDSDGDGLWDDWERFGIDVDGDGVIDLDLPALGANWQHKDIFVEVDWMDCAVAGGDCAMGDTHNHKPKPAAIAAVVNAFANANVTNPDGVNGINIHIDVSNSIPHQNALNIPGLCFAGGAGIGNFDTVKTANFNSARRFAYHYCLFTHQQVTTSTSSGCGELPGNDFQVALGGWNLGSVDLDGDGLPDANVGTVQQQSGTLMHELGHNLQLQHGGGDSINYKPNYLSVMNYRYQMSGIAPTDPDGVGPMAAKIDYSKSALATLTESSLSEPAGVGDGTDTVFWRCPSAGALKSAVGNAALDWNCDADTIDLGVSSDINADGVTGTLTGFFDWANILYEFQTTGAFEDGDHQALFPVQEITYPEYLQFVAPELSIAQSPSSASVVTGSNVTYTIQVKNNHSTAAASVVVTDNLPDSLTFVSCSSTLGGVCGGSGNNRSVSFSTLAGGATATIQLVATLNCAVSDGTSITNSASVAAVTPDSDLSNNSSASVIVASNPPPVISGASVDKAALWPPNHKMVDVSIAYTLTDNCDVDKVARSLSVSSNEPVDGTGDGDTAPDWEVVDANHVRLRAERAGSGSGRLYTITITVTDTAGGSSSKTVTVSVPLNRR